MNIVTRNKKLPTHQKASNFSSRMNGQSGFRCGVSALRKPWAEATDFSPWSASLRLEDFNAWQEAITLAEMIYELTKKFPPKERYGLTSQLQRAAVSVSANLAEGFGRQASKDKEHFYIIARGSLYETKSLLIVAQRIKLMQEMPALESKLLDCLSLLGGLLRSHRSNT